MNKLHASLAGATFVLLLGGGAALTFGKASGVLDQKDSAAKNPGMVVLATVDNHQITEAELAPMLQQGVPRETALDRRITQSVIAMAAEAEYGEEAKILLAANRNDILYQLYLSKRTEALRKSITEAEIKAFYDKNVKDEDFKQVALKIFLTSDAREAQTLYETMARASAAKGDMAAASAKMTYLQKEGDHFVALQAVPYNLGQVIKKMNQGDVLQPIVVREGVLVTYIEAFKNSPKPPLDKSKDEIRQLIMQERLSAEVMGLRKAASINLKG